MELNLIVFNLNNQSQCHFSLFNFIHKKNRLGLVLIQNFYSLSEFTNKVSSRFLTAREYTLTFNMAILLLAILYKLSFVWQKIYDLLYPYKNSSLLIPPHSKDHLTWHYNSDIKTKHFNDP